MHCPYEQNRIEEGDIIMVEGEPQIVEQPGVSQCLVLSVASGFVCSTGQSICEYCISGTAWNDAVGVPQLRPEDVERTPSSIVAMALVKESPFFKSLYLDALRCRLISGDCPRYQVSSPVDLSDAFTKYHSITNDKKAEDLLLDMLDKQIEKAIANVDGVHPESIVRDKIATLAEDNGLISPVEATVLRNG